MKLPDKYMWEAGYLTAAELCRCFPCKTAQNPGKRSHRTHSLLNGSRRAWGTFGWKLTRLRTYITWKVGQEWCWWRVVVAPSPAILPSLAAARLPAPGGSRLRFQVSRQREQQQPGVVEAQQHSWIGVCAVRMRTQPPSSPLQPLWASRLTGGNAQRTDDRQFVVKFLEPPGIS